MKFWNLTSNFETHKNIGQNFDYIYRYMYTLSMHHKGINIIEGYFGYQKWTFIPKKRKITYVPWFWNFWPRPPTWHETFKPIRLLVTILISYTSRHIHRLYTHKVWRNLKDTFDIPSHPSTRPPVQPVPSNSAFGLVV